MKGLIKSIGILIIFLMVSSVGYAATNGPLIDDAGLLTDSQYWELYNRAEEISKDYQCDVVIITMNHIDANDAYEYANYLRKELDYGYGPDKSVILLLLSMEERDYALVAIEANNYIDSQGLLLTNKEDVFLYRRESIREIESKSSCGSSVDSSGSSGRSGKF